MNEIDLDEFQFTDAETDGVPLPWSGRLGSLLHNAASTLMADRFWSVAATWRGVSVATRTFRE
jgi:hypothetical protein